MMTLELLKNARIMIVEDDRANLKLLNIILSNHGYQQTTLIEDPREVLPQYKAEKPDLILLDINMPFLSGFEVMEQLKALDDEHLPPIIILTAQHGQDYLNKGLSLGARDYVTKPYDFDELVMRVRNLLEAHLASRLLYEQKVVLEELVTHRTKALNDSRLEIVRRLGRAAEYRDNETGSHILRMSKYSALLAKHLGWNPYECDLILNASPMHDIGKIGIPDAVLLKPGKLDEKEWEVMKTHVSIGADMLDGDNSDVLRMAREIALGHHEKWDGSGYPNGLAGGDIPLAARIVAVADVFDALTSSRPYKKAWQLEDAIDFIKNNAGSHFDPTIVKLFEECLPDILAISLEHNE